MEISTEIVKGSLRFIILQSLSEKEHYGYSLSQSIREKSDQMLKAGEGSLYPALYKLERDGYIESRWDESVSPKRKYYQLTAKGKGLLEEERKGWEKMMWVIKNYLHHKVGLGFVKA